MVKKTVLKNGLRVLTIPQKGTRTVTVLVLVGTGSKYETREQNGISHFLEHMFFKGTTNRPNATEVAEVLDCVGGAFNAFTGEDYTGYYAKVDATHWKLALEWVADIFVNSLLPVKEIEKEKGVVLEEIHMYRDNPARHVDDLWTHLLYGDQPAGRNIAGSEKSVLGLSRAMLKEYVKNQYVGSNTVVCIAGNINQEEAMRKAGKLFGSLSQLKAREKSPVKEEQKRPEILVEQRKIDQTQLVLGVRGYKLGDSKQYAQHLLATMLGGMMSSRLWVEVREKRGMAYSIGTSSECDPDTGYLATSAGVKNANAKKTIQLTLREYRRFKKEKVAVVELRKAKDHEKGKMALQLESSNAKAQFYSSREILEGRILTPEQIYDKIESVGIGDIQEAANDLFQPAKLNLAMLGPIDNKESFVKLLKI
jgi:predicted Zn-dependent peptidase